MIDLKNKVLRQISKCDEARRKLQSFVDSVNNTLALLKEKVDDIRIEPRRIGIPKPATTTDDIAKMLDFNYGLPIGYSELCMETIRLQDLLRDEYKRITTKDKEVKDGGVYKSKEGTTICEVEEIKLDKCEVCGEPTKKFSLNMCEECFDEETDNHYDGGRDDE